jgi:hypothetical protein
MTDAKELVPNTKRPLKLSLGNVGATNHSRLRSHPTAQCYFSKSGTKYVNSPLRMLSVT